MIVPMKKVSLICLATDREKALERLQKLGVMHLESAPAGDSEDRQVLKAKTEDLRRLIGILKIREKGARGEALHMRGHDLADYARTVIQGHDEIGKAIVAIDQEIARMAPWGDFSMEQIEALKGSGVNVYLCESTQEVFEQWSADSDVALARELWWLDNRVGYALVSLADLGERELPLAILPEKRLAKLEQRRRELQSMAIALEQDLDELVASVPQLRSHIGTLESEYDFLAARDGMEEAGEVLLLHGFVPEPAVESLEKTALAAGWALSITEPGGEDRVPTLLKESKAVGIVKPLFDFLGILPGYRELDISAGVLVFFTIFFGMIVNDAGYGALFLALGLWGRRKFRESAQAKTALSLLVLLSSVSVVWGVLNGSYFGLEFGGLKWLTESTTRNNHIQLICFILGLSQLVIGRLWQVVTGRGFRRRIGHIGWALMLCGNFIVILNLLNLAALPEWSFKLMFGCYGAGLLMVVAGAVNWLDVADIFQFPFAIINSFVDLLSYIRLFAVGLAGYYIALNFNEMGVGLAGSSWFMWLPGAVVVLFGHALNISLCLMSVLVHGVRLNTLEFSNHTGLTWSGVEYKPLAGTGTEKTEDQ